MNIEPKTTQKILAASVPGKPVNYVEYLQAENRRLEVDLDSLRAQLASMTVSRDEWERECKLDLNERDEAHGEAAKARAERDAALKRVAAMQQKLNVMNVMRHETKERHNHG